jgi:hypothetical protein
VKVTAAEHDLLALGFQRHAEALRVEILAHRYELTMDEHDRQTSEAREYFMRATEHRFESAAIRAAEHDELLALRQAVWHAQLEAADQVPNYEEDDYAAGAVNVARHLPAVSPMLCAGCGSTIEQRQAMVAAGARACCPDDTLTRVFSDFDQTRWVS